MSRGALFTVLAVLGTIATAGCASTSRQYEGPRPRAGAHATERANSAVQGWQISSYDGSLFAALMRVQPGLLRAGAPTVTEPRGAMPVVFVDDRLAGDLGVLHTMSPRLVREVRRYSRVELAVRFGRGDLNSAIVVTTR
jgi:hypothetical protein